MRILAIDPGPLESGWVEILEGNIGDKFKWPNAEIDFMIASDPDDYDLIAIEVIAGYGMKAGQEIFSTCEWIGRFSLRAELMKLKVLRLKRKEIVTHICDNPRAGDKDVREAMIDRWGIPGTKKAPGGTYGFSGDMWSALAIATTAWDLHGVKP